MKKTELYHNISQCLTLSGAAKKDGRNPKEMDLSIIEDAAVIVDPQKQKIEWVGKTKEVPKTFKGLKKINCKGEVWLPALVECHTHLIYGGFRHLDFAKRARGKTYAEVAQEGGGINSTVAATRESSKKQLLDASEEHLKYFENSQVGALEIKSGYGLSLESETKILEVAQSLKRRTKIKLVNTFMPAHAVPPEFKGRKQDYISEILKWIPEVAKMKMATFFDAFIENNYFSAEEAKKMAEVALKSGFKLKFHVDQFADLGGVELGIVLNATSLDHLDHISKKNIQRIAKSNTVAVLLPGASLYTQTPYPPARELIDNGAMVALSTDFNPGTCPSRNLPLQMTIACTQMKMTVPEVIVATTLNASRALDLHKEFGSIEVGKKSAFSRYRIPSYEYLPYCFGDLDTKLKN